MKHIDDNNKCPCGGLWKAIDGRGWSSTLACNKCHCCRLVISPPSFRLTVPLKMYRFRRDEGLSQRLLDSRSMAVRLIDALSFDQWPTSATIVDFGIDSAHHLGALQHAVIVGITAYDLDRVLGDGPAITALTRGLPRQPYPDVVFRTAYDARFMDLKQA